MPQTGDWQGTWTIDYLTWSGDRNQGVVILDEDRCLSGGDSLYRYSGRYTVRDRTLLCDGVEMTPAHGGHVTPWGEEAPTCQVVLWGRMAGASIEGMMINPGNPHLRFRMTRRTDQVARRGAPPPFRSLPPTQCEPQDVAGLGPCRPRRVI